MLDFKRIGGEIVSSPLNENFRKLRNDISISNTNLVFSETDPVKDTIAEMNAIKDPVNAQVCYVVSSGELYRYAAYDQKWHKIADFGQTFRQGFLNSGAVVLEGDMTLADSSLKKIATPNMLVYFKNREGNENYLMGMYKIDNQIIDIADSITGGAGSYSIYVDSNGSYTVVNGMPSEDDVDHIYIGTFLVNDEGQIIQAKDPVSGEVLSTCLYTLPDMAYTADRGSFLVYGGQANGMNLIPSGNDDAKVNRLSGYYYDEGINYIQGQVKNYPVDSFNNAGFNIKKYEVETPVPYFIYLAPERGLSEPITVSKDLIYNKYWKEGKLEEVEEGFFTIQQHLVTPAGQNIMIYGTQLYNSMTDAVSNINATHGLDIEFPYVEATRIVLGKAENETKFSTDKAACFQYYTMSHISQVGTISPEYADDVFKIYSGDDDDISPSTIRFDLGALQRDNIDDLYYLGVLSKNTKRKVFGIEAKYHTDNLIDENIVMTQVDSRKYGNPGVIGYEIADAVDLDYATQRITDIEQEIWGAIGNDEKQRHEQSIRYRLYHSEIVLDKAVQDIKDNRTDIQHLQENKVNKGTKINGQTLGDTTGPDEKKEITLYTKDIDEPAGATEEDHQWFRQDRVSNNVDVKVAKEHVETVSTGTKDDTLSKSSVSGHVQKNPHNLSTDDLVVLKNSQKLFVTPDEERRIRSDRLPENTKEELNKKIENISIASIAGNSQSTSGSPVELGNVKALHFYQHGAKVSVANGTATIECVGQTNPDDFLLKDEFAKDAKKNPGKYYGAVDRAIVADNVTALKTAGPNQYYGTTEEKDPEDPEGKRYKIGAYDLPKYVTTEDASDFTDVDQVTFAPINKSITLKHLADSKVIYGANSEENKLQTNVYDLVKNHYHKVFNNNTQGPYKPGSISIQDTSSIKYEYEVPSGGLLGRDYYFSYNNDTYSFTGATNMVAKTVLTYVPSTGVLTYTVPGGNSTALTIDEVTNPDTIDDNYWLPFAPKTDWNKINEWNFGDTLTVNVVDGRATINVKDVSNIDTPYSNYFGNLADVNVTMNSSNLGKMLVLGQVGNEYKLQFTDAPPLNKYMEIIDYVDSVEEKRVQYAALADNATVAASANTLQTKYTVNDSATSNTNLWTAAKTKSNTTAQIKAEGVNTYYGTSAPTTIQGAKDGDLYIMIEG